MINIYIQILKFYKIKIIFLNYMRSNEIINYIHNQLVYTSIC